MNKLEYDIRLKELIREANSTRFQVYEGDYFNYLNSVKRISQFRKKSRENVIEGQDQIESCPSCNGTGKQKDSTGFYPFNCDDCRGSGVRDVLTHEVLTPQERHGNIKVP
jgi:DnaJ-class molecular chaperone